MSQDQTPDSVKEEKQASSKEFQRQQFLIRPEDIEQEILDNEALAARALAPSTRTPPKAKVVKRQRMRIKKALEDRQRRASIWRRSIRETGLLDPRGEPEVRICSLNLNNFGLKSEVKRVLKNKRRPKLKKTFRSVLEAIPKANCDVVAVQAIIGKTIVKAKEGLALLSAKLSEDTAYQWKEYVGSSNSKIAYNGFLVNSDKLDVQGTITHTDKLLPRFEEYNEKKFVRGPFEIRLRVKGKGHKTADKNLILVNMHLQKGLLLREPEPEALPMQMAEGIRQLFSLIRKQVADSKSTIFVVLGDRSSPRNSPSNYILNGSLQLADFGVNRLCKFGEQGILCEGKPNRPRELFSVFTDVFSTSVSYVKRAVEGEEKWFRKKPTPKEVFEQKTARISQTADIYLLDRHLKYARIGPSSNGSFMTGTEAVLNNLEQSPLIWVELNW